MIAPVLRRNIEPLFMIASVGGFIKD